MALTKNHVAASFFLLTLSLHFLASSSANTSVNNVNALLKLKESLKNPTALANWIPSNTPCFGGKNNWVGLICSKGGNIWGIKLENMGLTGTINVTSLSALSKLRAISFMNNSFDGSVPDFRKLKAIKSIFLSNNKFEGKLAVDAFEGMRRMKKLHLANNKLSGEIPKSLGELHRLVELRLEGNGFEGAIPDFRGTILQNFNVSGNQLQGPIPSSVSKFDTTTFAGNKELCGPPLNPCPPPIPTSLPPPLQSQPDKSTPLLPLLIALPLLAILLILLLTLILSRRKHHRRSCSDPSDTQHPLPPPSETVADDGGDGSEEGGSQRSNKTRTCGGESGKLTFIKEERERFEMGDLLKAAAEILGSGSFGSSYKATLLTGSTVVVKRYKKMNQVGKEEFQEHMRRIGRLEHPNVLPLVGYYYTKEEKLLVTDVMQPGSLAVLLHGQSRGQKSLNWPTRLKIIKGVARGLAHLYKELPGLVAPHGHLKSSNVLLNASYEAILSDYGLIPLINQESAQQLMVAYKSPEYIDNKRINKKTDVFSLGILILETLTGRFPASYLHQGSEVDLTSWVREGVDNGFDKEMGLTEGSEGEMQKLLQIGVDCCESTVGKRFDIEEAYQRINEVRERDNSNNNDDDFYSACASTEADQRSSRGLSGDFTVTIN